MKNLRLLPLLLLALLGCRSTEQATIRKPDAELVFFHLNDVYEIGALEGGTLGGMARVATQIKALDQKYTHVYPVLAGDFVSPSVIGTVRLDGNRVRGAQMIDIMNQAGIEYVTFGNHEFDIPYEDLQKRMNESKFEWISGNVRRKTANGILPFARFTEGREKPFPEYTILEVTGKSGRIFRIGILAVCLDANKQDFVQYEEVFESAQKHYQLLDPQTDAIVALTHLNADQDRELARRLPGLTLIMGGHDHEKMSELIGEVALTKADANAKSAWVHTLSFSKTGKAALSSLSVRLDSSIVPDPAVAAAVSQWEQRAYQAFRDQGLDPEAPVAVLPEPLDGLESHIRTQPTNLGDVLTRSMLLAWPTAQAAVVNSGSVRIDDYLSGSITQLDVIRALPFGGKVLLVEMKGDLLIQILEAGLKNKGTGGYLQLARIEKKGGIWHLGQVPIAAAQTYTLAVGDYLLTGKENNLAFLTPEHPGIVRITEPDKDNLGRDIRLALVAYFQKK